MLFKINYINYSIASIIQKQRVKMKISLVYVIIGIFFTSLAFAEVNQYKYNKNKNIDIILKEQSDALELILKDDELSKEKSKDYSKLSAQEKVNLMLKNQELLDKLLKNQDVIETRDDNNPFKDKRFGIEINLVTLLIMKDELREFSGTFSLFYPKNNIEVAFPFLTYSETYDGDKINQTMIDMHIRKFIEDTMNGYYIGAFTRAEYLQGTLKHDDLYYGEPKNIGSESKLGVGFSIGYREFLKSGFYWGMSFSLGRFLIGENDLFAIVLLDDSDFIVDIELLKVGYAF